MKSIREYLDLSEANMPIGRQVPKYTSSSSDDLTKSLASMGAAGGAGAALKKSVKTLAPAAKVIPGAMSAMSVHDAWERYKEGDTSGAVISVLAAAGYLVPGPMGWTLGGAADAVNLGRDIGSGVYDPLAQAAKDFVNEEKRIMNNLEHITALRQTLSKIEEGPGAATGRQVAKAASRELATVPGQPGRSVIDMGKLDAIEVQPRPLSTSSATTPGQTAAAATKGSNAGKTLGAAAAIGAAGTAGYLATKGGGGGANPPATAAGGRTGGGANPPATAAGGLTPEEEQELALLADKLGKHMGRNPQLDALLLRHTKHRGNQPTPPL